MWPCTEWPWIEDDWASDAFAEAKLWYIYLHYPRSPVYSKCQAHNNQPRCLEGLEKGDIFVSCTDTDCYHIGGGSSVTVWL